MIKNAPIADTPEEAINGFFNALNDKAYPVAFNYLTERFQEGWTGRGRERDDQKGLAKFTSGYHYLVAVKNVRFSSLKPEEMTRQYQVKIPGVPDLFTSDTLAELAVAELGTPQENIAQSLLRISREILKAYPKASEEIRSLPMRAIVQRKIIRQPKDEEQDAIQFNLSYTNIIKEFTHHCFDRLQEEKLSHHRTTIPYLYRARDFLIDDLKADPDKVHTTRLSHFFNPNSVSVCLYNAGLDSEEVSSFFGFRVSDHNEYRRAICVKTDKGYKIDGLRYQ